VVRLADQGRSTSPSPPGAFATPPSSLETIYDLAKLEFNAQFQLSERYDAKVRNTLGLTTLIFGVTQAAFAKNLSDAHHGWRTIVVILAVAAFLGLCVAFWMALRSFLPSKDTAAQVKAEYLRAKLDEISNNAKTQFDLVNELVLVVETRQQDARERAKKMLLSQWASISALLFVLAELVAQLIALIHS
jgi:hypothetical protein